VLLIDELNRAIFHPSRRNLTTSHQRRQQQVLWDYLKKDFLIENRVLVFSTHDIGTTTMLSDDCFTVKSSNRRVIVSRLPRISTEEELEKVKDHTSFKKFKAACLGFIPAQIVDYATVKYAAEVEILEGASENRVDAFACACLDGDPSALDYRICSRADYFESRCVWSPFWIVHLLRVCQPVSPLTKQWTDTLRAFMLDRMDTDFEVWELFVTLALILRRLRKPYEHCAHTKRVTSNPDTFGFHVAPENVTDTAELVEYLNTGVIDNEYEHLVVVPRFRQFLLYDVVEARKDSGRWELISGYQMKVGKGKPKVATIEGASWLVSLNATEKTFKKPRKDKFIKLNRSEVQKFLGVSLWDCAEKLRDVFPSTPDDDEEE
jgi:hypothetical protein